MNFRSDSNGTSATRGKPGARRVGVQPRLLGEDEQRALGRITDELPLVHAAVVAERQRDGERLEVPSGATGVGPSIDSIVPSAR